jgi:hypothetical protein
MAAEQIRQALRLIGGRSKDAGANRTLFGFANKEAAQQIGETLKDLRSQQWTENRNEIKQSRW